MQHMGRGRLQNSRFVCVGSEAREFCGRTWERLGKGLVGAGVFDGSNVLRTCLRRLRRTWRRGQEDSMRSAMRWDSSENRSQVKGLNSWANVESATNNDVNIGFSKEAT